MVPSLHAPLSVLVTGGAGLIGAEVTRLLLGQGMRVVVADDLSAGGPLRLSGAQKEATLRQVDVAEPGVLRHLLEHEGPFDVVLHLAARVGVRAVLRDPEACRRQHQDACRELIVALGTVRPVPRLVFSSSSEVYQASSAPLSETSALRPAGGEGRWAYASSKRWAEEEFVAAHARLGWPVEPLILRFFNVIGPNQLAHSGMVVPTFVDCALRGLPLPVHGDGSQLRTFAHVTDVAEDVVRLVRGDVSFGGTLNLGGSMACTMLELARCVLKQIGQSPDSIEFVDPVGRLGRGFAEVHERIPDLGRARTLGLACSERQLDDVIREVISASSAEVSRPCVSPVS